MKNELNSVTGAEGDNDKTRSQSVPAGATGRRGLLAGVAALAALSGAGLAWWRYTPHEVVAEAEAEFWALSLPTPQGQSVVLASLRGRPLLVNFWATWCPPCIEELPMLNAFHQENSSKGWQVIGLAVDQATSVINFLARQPVDFPVVMAGSGGTTLGKLLGNAAGGLPFTVVFGADGRIRARKIGKVSPSDLATWRDLK